MKIKFWILCTVFVVGIGLGISVPTLAPKYFQTYFPQAIQGSKNRVEGIVVQKQHEPDRLLLTISSSDGAVLATFKKKVTEISLLIEEGDTVTLNVRAYEPFVDDPAVMRVRKPNLDNPPPDVDVPLEPDPLPEANGTGVGLTSDQPE